MMKHRIFRTVILSLLFTFISMTEAKAAYYASTVTAHVVQRTGTSVYGGTVMVHDYYGDQSYDTTSSGSDISYSKGGDVDMVLNAKADDGYKFSGWFINESDANPESSNNPYTKTYAASTERYGTNSYDIYAKFTPEQYTISFAANGGSGTGPANISYNIESTDKVFPACPYTRAGYDFSGWKPADDVGNWKTTDSYSASQTVSQKWGNVTLNAQWTPKTYTITYDADGGTLSSAGNQSYTIESTSALKTATKPGYTFDGWKVTQIDSNEGNWTLGETAVSPLNMKYGNVTLKAQWATADITISVSGLDSNDSAIFTVSNGTGVLYTVALSGSNPSVTIKDLPTGVNYTVKATSNWSWAYGDPDPTGYTFGLGSSGYTASFEYTKKSSVKKHDEQQKVNWK